MYGPARGVHRRNGRPAAGSACVLVNGNCSASRNLEESNMQIERLQVTNHERWGKLVKTWATGVNYMDDENNYPLPETMEEFKEQLAKAQVFATVPERFTKIEFVSSEQDTILVRLPPKVMIEDSESLLNKPGSTYPLPPFYKRLFNGLDPVIPEEERLRVHAERIGDYTISVCA